MFDTQRLEINRQWADVNNDFENRRKNVRVAARETQVDQFREKVERDAIDHLVADKASQSHINYCMTNSFQTENTNTCQSQLANNRVLPYHWKGMNEQQKKSILQDQERMREERRMRDNLEKDEGKLWAMQQEEVRRMKVKMDRMHKRGQRKNLNEMVEYNKLKAKEDKIRDGDMYMRTHDYKVF